MSADPPSGNFGADEDAGTGWVVTLACTRHQAEAADSDEAFATDPQPPVLVAREVDEATDAWVIDAYCATRPDAAQLSAIAALVPGASVADMSVQPLPDADWVTISQDAIQPVHAGRFYVHTQANRGTLPPGAWPIRIEASQAFGTGAHATTAGCLAALSALRAQGRRFGNIADIGTGTGVLTIAAQRLWPTARLTASDIDPVAVAVAADNARIARLRVGFGPRRVALMTAAGTDHPRIAGRGPYDLVIANILAGPLVTLAPALARIVAPGGRLLLAGLTSDQARRVRGAYRAAGFALVAARVLDSDDMHRWPVLTLRRRLGARRPARRARPRAHPADASYGSW